MITAIGKSGSRSFLGCVALVSLLFLGARAVASSDFDGDELRALQKAALRQAHLDESSRRSIEARLRLAPLLPELRVSVGRGWQWSYDGYPSSSSDDRMSFNVAARWDLGRLIYSHDEMLLRRDAQRLASSKTELLLRVAHLYGQRCSATRALLDEKSVAMISKLTGRVASLDVALAALTGDEHVGRKLRHCTKASTSIETDFESLLDPPKPLPEPTPAETEPRE